MKQTEINELSVEELNEKLTAFQKSYESARATHALSPLENPISIREQVNSRSSLPKHVQVT